MSTPRPASSPSREELISLCERGSVAESNWHDRDSAGAQTQLGKALFLLRAGCEFTFDNPPVSHECWWLTFSVKGFNYFEIGEMDWDHAYIPTAEKLDKAAGNDWY